MNSNQKTIIIGDKALTLRATFRALANIEDKTLKPFTTLIQDAAEGRFRIKDVAVILKEGSAAADAPLTDKEIEDLIEENGVLNVATGLAEFLAAALYGGVDKPVEKKVAE